MGEAAEPSISLRFEAELKGGVHTGTHSDSDQDLTGVAGLLAFSEVLVCLPTLGSKELPLHTCLFPLASGWVIEQVFLGNPFPLGFFISLILMITF